tara:strand:+ start:35 stop:964 length:930 start_codon:yes stop_codon:yes gene_type:complete
MIYPSKITKEPNQNFKSESKIKNIFEKIKVAAQNVIYMKNLNDNLPDKQQKYEMRNITYKIPEIYSDNQYDLKLIDKKSNLLKSAQKLRYTSFFGKKLFAYKLDSDIYDKFSQHLIVVDNNKSKNKVIGTYRLLDEAMMPPNFDFYTSSEFDISKLKKNSSNILEVGRSCVDERYRDGRIIKLLWRGLATEIIKRDIDLVIGCASFPTTIPNKIIEELSYLKHFHSPPKEYNTVPIDSKAVNYPIIRKEKLNFKKIFKHLPPLIKAYIRTGAWFGRGAVIDSDFKTIDVCVILKTQNIKNKYLDLAKKG